MHLLKSGVERQKDWASLFCLFSGRLFLQACSVCVLFHVVLLSFHSLQHPYWAEQQEWSNTLLGLARCVVCEVGGSSLGCLFLKGQKIWRDGKGREGKEGKEVDSWHRIQHYGCKGNKQWDEKKHRMCVLWV
ncbi:uncharacterized protein LY89DRAFT_231540 [Mollisia scopiformis]|uniref:Uncharacterized protein n=1 Tax=Mollisia scopiformis TaxID=149040 RepID=A0A194WUW4_MOLSC|nr:uncharacterized protein LY89DRAFT_231540 [Mollisia scopiformis]KUJ11745.1 hypothetical protein LY89DRAFT_231540 [Mollisia scopiformis]